MLEDNPTQLLRDVLSQHRRLTAKLDLLKFIKSINSESWRGVDISVILDHIEYNKFNCNYLEDYALLSKCNKDYRKYFYKFILNYETDRSKFSNPGDYGTYMGHNWSMPIHFAILCNYSENDKLLWFNRFKDWQENSYYLSQIGPHFGLSYDYDMFILETSPPLLALIASLMYEVPGAVRYISVQLRHILQSLSDRFLAVPFFNAVWLMHLSASVEDSYDLFELGQRYINEHGGISCECLYNPPSCISIEESDEWSDKIQESPCKVPNLIDFRRHRCANYNDNNSLLNDPTDVAIDALTNPNGILYWGEYIPRLLINLSKPDKKRFYR